jgi:outer membrane protease
MVGVMVGVMKFCAFGGSYIYDSQGLVLTYEHDKGK